MWPVLTKWVTCQKCRARTAKVIRHWTCPGYKASNWENRIWSSRSHQYMIWIWMGYIVKKPILAIIYYGGVCAHVIECLSRRSGDWNQLWFQPGPATRLVGSSRQLFLQKNEFLNYCSVWALGTIKLLVLLVVGQNLRIHGGEMFRFNVSCLFFGGQKKGEGWDRSSDSSVHKF